MHIEEKKVETKKIGSLDPESIVENTSNYINVKLIHQKSNYIKMT